VLGFIGVMLGFFFIVLAPLLRWYVTPSVEKAPTDIYDEKVAEGEGQYFIITEARLSDPTTIRDISIYKGDPDASSEDTVVIENFSRTIDMDKGADFNYHLETYVMDRVTGEAVHCCGESPRKDGYTLKLPFHTEQKDYPLYNDGVSKAFPAVYSGEEEVAGLNTYKFVSEVPQTLVGTMEVPGVFVGRPDEPQVYPLRYYQATTTIWVEPTTGAVIKRSQTSHQWLYDNVGDVTVELAIITATDNEETVSSTADDVSAQVSQLKIISVYAPIILPILGVGLLLGGLYLARKGEEAEAAETSASRAGAPAS
jgi:hypothetical protein